MDFQESECPLCLGRMQLEERGETVWQFCPNGCPTEFEEPVRKPLAIETENRVPSLQARAAGS